MHRVLCLFGGQVVERFSGETFVDFPNKSRHVTCGQSGVLYDAETVELFLHLAVDADHLFPSATHAAVVNDQFGLFG